MTNLFEDVDFTASIDKETFKSTEGPLRRELIQVQSGLMASRAFPVYLVMTGFDVLQRARSARRLMHWLDPRHIRRYGRLSGEKDTEARLAMSPYWDAQPQRGQIGLFVNSWYDRLLRRVAADKLSTDEVAEACERIREFETLVIKDGALVLKVAFLHKEGEELQALRAFEEGPSIPWKVTKADRKFLKAAKTNFDGARLRLHDALSLTHSTGAPWHGISASDQNHADMALGRLLVSAIEEHAQALSDKPDHMPAIPSIASEPPPDPITNVVPVDEYKTRLRAAQKELTKLTLSKAFEKQSLVVVFEGHDAAGKGGAIRRIAEALDLRMARAVRISAPSKRELEQHYLWRFWRKLPKRGRITLFDRSWYGRVLVERLEGFASDAEWQRAYEEIRQFEQQMVSENMMVVKFWLGISKAEQLLRFRDRENAPHKQHKITPEDWRNREKWDDYQPAIHDMISQTHDIKKPWYHIETDDKKSARVHVLESLVSHLSSCLCDET